MEAKQLQIVNDIIAFSNSAMKLYDKLAELDYNGLIGSKEWNDSIDLLRYIQDYENKKFDQLNVESLDFQKHLLKLTKMYNLRGQDLLYTLTTTRESDLGAIRFISKEQSFEVRNNIILPDISLSKEEVREIMEELGEDAVQFYDDEDNKISSDDFFNYKRELDDDFDEEDEEEELDEKTIEEETDNNHVSLLRNEALSHTYISYLNEYIKNTTDKKLKMALLKVKYRTIGINSTLEEYFLDRGPYFLMPKLFQRCIEVEIKRKERAYKEHYLYCLENEIEESLYEFSTIENPNPSLSNGGLITLIETIFTQACNSLNPSYVLEGNLEVFKQNTLKTSKSDYAKERIKESFSLKKELTISKNVDL